MTLKKRTFVKIISFFTAIVIVLCGTIMSGMSKNDELITDSVSSFRQDLNSATDYFSQIDTDLKKASYSSDNEYLSALSVNIAKNCAAAKVCLERMPLDEATSSALFKFLAQAGDYCSAIAEKENINEKNLEQLQKLSSYSSSISDSFNEVNATNSESEIKELDVSSIKAEFEDCEQIAGGYPTLIYDGPFSDHVNERNPAIFEGAEKTSKESALLIAKKIIGENAEYSSDENSFANSYIFTNGSSTAAITKKGGYLLYMQKNSNVSSTEITTSYALNTALGTLESIYGEKFKESYYLIDENVITINYAYMLDDITCYPDLIKVSVSMKSAEILAIDARNYIMNHQNREYPKTKVSVENAQKCVSESLKVVSAKKCIIADDSFNEYICYEFTCKSGSDTVLCYINAQTKKEQEILLLVKSENGTLTK